MSVALPEITPASNAPKLPQDEWWNWESLLPMDLIRVHTKSEDVPYVTDQQLNLYRKAAIETAEQYTGLLLFGIKTVTQHINEAPRNNYFRRQQRVTLRYPSHDGVLYLYGGHHAYANMTVHVEPGATRVVLPVVHTALDLRSCCSPCNTTPETNYGIRLMYRAGYDCENNIPAGIIVGMLKYIAWNVEHPGDELLTQRNSITLDNAGVAGSNNTALVSGALEEWRRYMRVT